MHPFSSWLAKMLHEHKSDVDRLLNDQTALHFLITWSLFESKCFSGFLRAKCLRAFSDSVIKEGLSTMDLGRQLEHFHTRYRDGKKLGNLLHDDKTPTAVVDEFKRCLTVEMSNLSARDRIFTVVFVIYRFRNNMFHGNKRAESWLRFREEIGLCTEAMQVFVAHSEKLRPSMQIAAAA